MVHADEVSVGRRGGKRRSVAEKLAIVQLTMEPGAYTRQYARIWTVAWSSTRDFGLSDFERPIQSKLFVLLVPGEGANPHDRKARRILGPPRLPVTIYISVA